MMPELDVYAPDGVYQADADMTALWEEVGALFEVAKQRLGFDVAISVILSRVTRELRREHGVDGAKETLRQYIETMAKASEGDRQ